MSKPEEVRELFTVFAQAGFRGAIVARNAPSEAEEPSWDPDDVRYNVMRWAPRGWRNALGAAVVDPRSGEVIGAEGRILAHLGLPTRAPPRTSARRIDLFRAA